MNPLLIVLRNKCKKIINDPQKVIFISSVSNEKLSTTIVKIASLTEIKEAENFASGMLNVYFDKIVKAINLDKKNLSAVKLEINLSTGKILFAYADKELNKKETFIHL